MLSDLPKHPTVSETVSEASDVLGEDAFDLDAAAALVSTLNAQIALLISGVAAARALVSEGAHPKLLAGHSVGTFAAAVIAKVIDLHDAIRVVRLRGELMEQAYPSGYGMGVIVGLTERRVRSLVDEVHSANTPVFVANVNSPTQIVISGADGAIVVALDSARGAGAHRAERLPIPVPSHSPLMSSVADRLSWALAEVRVREPTIPCVGNRTGRVLRNAEEIRQDLATNVAYPVRWHDATTLLFELGARLFVEMPPGQVLTRLAATAFPEVRPLALEEIGIEAASRFVMRSRGST